MNATVTETRSYRCIYVPLSPAGIPIASETGILPFVQVRAANAEDAHHRAHHVTGCPVSHVERRDDEVAA